MAGFQVIKTLRQFESDCFDLGLHVGEFVAGNNWPNGSHDLIKLSPLNDCLPHYSRDAELFVGTIEEAVMWLRGIRWASEYDAMIKVSSDKTRETAEQKERNRQLMRSIKTGTRVEGDYNGFNNTPILTTSEDEDIPF